MDLIGVKNALLANISAVLGLNDPQYKVSAVGALKAVLENNAVKGVTNLAGLQSGSDTVIKVRGMVRGVEADVSLIDDCETSISPAFVEHTIGKSNFAKIGIFVSDDQMRTFEAQAAAGFQVNGVTVPSILYEMILVKVNGLIQKIDRTIVTAIGANAGKNVVTGNNLAQTVNFASTLVDDDGYVKLLTDAESNEVNGELMIIGSGIIRNFDILNKLKTAADSNGFSAVDYKVYNDPKTASEWGANQFVVAQNGSIGFADWQKYAAPYGGMKGTSMFFTVPVPVQLANGELTALVLDAQLQYKDCPVWVDNAQVGTRGWVLELSKSFGVYTAPTTMFAASDPLYGVNGIFKYVADKEEAPVSIINVTGITTSAATKSIAAGATYDFGATLAVAPANATAKNLIVYNSATQGKATVDANGIVTGVAAGTSVITATTVDGGYSVVCTVTVTGA